MFNIVLYQPEIPPNTGNIIRLCANTGSSLHLVQPLGFSLDDKQLRRAGLDYHEAARITSCPDLESCLSGIVNDRVFAVSTRGGTDYTANRYQRDDTFIFGPETRGLPQDLLDSLPPSRVIRIPMQANNRSLNLSNAVAVVIYEAWRQNGFRES